MIHIFNEAIRWRKNKKRKNELNSLQTLYGKDGVTEMAEYLIENYKK